MKNNDKHPILYREIEPAEYLKEYISCYWQFEYFPDSPQVLDHSVLPDGCTSLVFILEAKQALPYLGFSGPRIDLFKTKVSPGSLYIGVRFLPQAFQALFGLSPKEIKGQNVPAYEYLEGFDHAMISKVLIRGFNKFDLLDRLFRQYISIKKPRLDIPISKAIQLALSREGLVKVVELAAVAHLSVRQFQRRFKFVTGLRPKEFLKIRRLRSSAIKLLLEEADYQDVLLQSGYFDQAHFIHDFSLVAGTNPTLFGKYISKIKHEGVK